MERKLISSLKQIASSIGKAAFLLILVNLSEPLFAQSSASFRTLKHVEPTKIEDYDLPKPVLTRIKSLKPDEIVKMDEEVQQTVRTEKGDKVVKLRLRFNDDYIVGYFEEVPTNAGSSAASNDFAIVVPVEFVCATNKDHEKQHTGRLSELKELEEKHKCTGWHQQDYAAVAEPKAPKQQQKKQNRRNNSDSKLTGFDKAAMKVIGMATFVFVAAAVR